MSHSDTIMALGKVIIAAAWADGEVTYEEVNSMKDLLFRLPGLTSADWAELDIYIESPVDEAERERLVDDLKQKLRSGADKQLALQALEDLIAADGVITDEEREVADAIRAEIESASVGMLGLSKMLVNRRSNSLADVPNREQFLDDFVKNKVYYNLQRRLEAEGQSFSISDEDLRKLGLAGGLMGILAWVDNEITGDEVAAIEEAMQTQWGVSAAEAQLVAEIAVDETTKRLDLYRTTREFYNACSREEYLKMLDVLFAVAAADGMASYDEIEQIRKIADIFKLEHKYFIDAKLKIPKDRREA